MATPASVRHKHIRIDQTKLDKARAGDVLRRLQEQGLRADATNSMG